MLHKAVVDLDFDKLLSALTSPDSPARQDINVQEEHGYTPLMSGAALGTHVSEELIRKIGLLLLKHGASVGSRDKDGFTPLHWAAAVDNATMCAVLIQAGAELNARS